ncbi:MAG: hypothetical protein FWC19_06790 [Treponema sp.]|nr:hypothetical protein [Treponema sp.]MCL2272492.1 hypothetical protein [Treponema sp.]
MALYRVTNGEAELIADISKQSDWNQENQESKDFIKNKPKIISLQDVTDIINDKSINSSSSVHVTSIRGASFTSFVAERITNTTELNSLRGLFNNNAWAANGTLANFNNNFKNDINRLFQESFIDDSEFQVLTLPTKSTNTTGNVNVQETISIIPFNGIRRTGIISSDYFELGNQPYSIKCKANGLISFNSFLLNTASCNNMGGTGGNLQVLITGYILLPKIFVVQKYENDQWIDVAEFNYEVNPWLNRGLSGRTTSPFDCIIEVKENTELRFCIRNSANTLERNIAYHLLINPNYTFTNIYYLTLPDDHPTKVPIDHPDSSIITSKYVDKSVTEAKIADNAITTEKIADRSITEPKMADNSISTRALIDSNVTTEKIADLNITVSKLENSLDLREKTVLVKTPAHSTSEDELQSVTGFENYYTRTVIDSKLEGKSDNGHPHTISNITDFPTALKNPEPLTINGQQYDGSSPLSFDIASSDYINSLTATLYSDIHSFIDNSIINKSDLNHKHSMEDIFESINENEADKKYLQIILEEINNKINGLEKRFVCEHDFEYDNGESLNIDDENIVHGTIYKCKNCPATIFIPNKLDNPEVPEE